MSSDSWASSEATRRSMVGNRGRDTGPELAIRRILHAAGHRYRVNARPLAESRRRADIVFGPSRVAVYVHGCFWHGCVDHYRPPKTNPEFWATKVTSNRKRDAHTEALLNAEGWLPVVVWEHEDPVRAARRISRIVTRRRGK